MESVNKFSTISNRFKLKWIKVLSFLVFILSTSNLIYNAVFCMEIIRNEASTLKQGAYSLLNNTYDRIYNNLKEYDNDLYRVEKTFNVTYNDALVFETNGITYSGSTYSKETHKFLERLGMKNTHVRVTYNSSCTKTVDMLLGIKYIISVSNHETLKEYNEEYEEEYFENKAKVLRNPYSLSIGYCVNSEIFNTNMNNNNTFELQNEILKNMTGIQENVYKMHKGEINKELNGLDSLYNIYKKTSDDGKISYEFEIEDTDNAYIYLLAESDEPIRIYLNDEQLKNHESITEYEMIDLGKRQIGDKIKLELIPNDDFIVDNIYVAYENEEILQKHYQNLSTKQTYMQKINGRKYKGVINISEDEEYLLFTIPYEEGWKITVDGNEVIKEKALEALISIKLNKGEHVIMLEYTPPKIYIGFIISMIGIISFVTYILYKKKNEIL